MRIVFILILVVQRIRLQSYRLGQDQIVINITHLNRGNHSRMAVSNESTESFGCYISQRYSLEKTLADGYRVWNHLVYNPEVFGYCLIHIFLCSILFTHEHMNSDRERQRDIGKQSMDTLKHTQMRKQQA